METVKMTDQDCPVWPYGRSPAMDGLPDLRAFNALPPEERARAAARHVEEIHGWPYGDYWGCSTRKVGRLTPGSLSECGQVDFCIIFPPPLYKNRRQLRKRMGA